MIHNIEHISVIACIGIGRGQRPIYIANHSLAEILKLEDDNN